jgi:DNA-binding phage protein
MNKKLLANHAGVHPNSLKNIAHPSWNPTLSTLSAIMDAVDRLWVEPKERQSQ